MMRRATNHGIKTRTDLTFYQPSLQRRWIFFVSGAGVLAARCNICGAATKRGLLEFVHGLVNIPIPLLLFPHAGL